MSKSIQLKDENGKVYPCPYDVGDLYLTTSSKHPNEKWGGKWELFGPGRTLVCVDTSQTEFNTVKKTGGAKTHTLIVAEIPSHSHSIQSGAKGNEWAAPNFVNSYQYQAVAPTTGYTVNYTGGGQAHNNLQPFITCYVWLRIE